MAKTIQDLRTILRNVTGRIDSSDPQFTDEIMDQYLTDFIGLQSTQDVRLFKSYTWWEFLIDETDEDPFPVNLQAMAMVDGTLGASTIGPLAYVDGFQAAWYQDPGLFYGRWPETQEYTPQRPTEILYYNNELTFRGPPDQEYTVKIQAYEVELQFGPDGDQPMKNDYMYRYICYGTALDIFSDYGEMERWNQIFPAFKRYRALVYGRTNSQYQSQRPSPEF